MRDGDVYVVNGQKIWTTMGHFAKFGILIARTNPDAPKHKGVSYFICPMDLPGIEVRPIVDMTGAHTFNEVFFDDVRIPAENLVGDENEGWGLAKVTLGNERVSLSGEGALWGRGPTAGDLVERVREAGGVRRPAAAPAAGRALHRGRGAAAHPAAHGERRGAGASSPGPEASVRKALADEHGQHIMGLAKDLAGAGGHARRPATSGRYGFLFAPALTIGGGTSEVQRNIIAERVLGLPHDSTSSRSGRRGAYAPAAGSLSGRRRGR